MLGGWGARALVFSTHLNGRCALRPFHFTPQDHPSGLVLIPPLDAGLEAPRGAPLGTIAKFRAATNGAKDLAKKGQESRQAFKARRWARKRVVCEFRLSAGKRIQHCMRSVQKGRQDIEIRRRLVSGEAAAGVSLFYAGLQTCGSVWDCPMCSAKISERRRLELVAAIAAWQALGGQVFMLTLTHGHHAGDRLADLIAGEQKALAWFFWHRAVRRQLKMIGAVGHVRAWEVTHGRFAWGNGWHPHFHILVFVKCTYEGARWADGTFAQLEPDLFVLWKSACKRCGLALPDARHGLSIDEGDTPGAYMAKMGLEDDSGGSWGLSHELTKGHIKRAAQGKGETPFELLDALLEDPTDRQAAELFKEFSAGFKGKSQLVWSRGLRALLGVGDDKDDEEIAAEVDPLSEVWARLTVDQWRMVLKAKAEAELLVRGETSGWSGVADFLNQLGVNDGR